MSDVLTWIVFCGLEHTEYFGMRRRIEGTLSKTMKTTQALSAALAALTLQSVKAQTLIDIVFDSDDLTTLETAIKMAELVEPLQGDGPFTVFAPNDPAFAPFPAKYLTDEWIPHLTDILLYHVISGAAVFSGDLMQDMEAETMNGESLTVSSLTPVTINDAEVIAADVNATNGVAHVINKVLLPSSATTNIVDLAVGSDDFSTLVDLLTAAELVDALQTDGPLTVFAPTNAAFDKLPEGTVDTLKDPANKDRLTDILLYHVMSGNLFASQLEEGAMLTALNDKDLTVTLSPAAINGAEITGADNLVSNGVIHVISSVLIPPEDPTDPPTSTSGSSLAHLPVFAVFAAAVVSAMGFY